MALDLLQQFLGGNPQKQQEYADFLQRYQQDPTSISDAEAARRYRELVGKAHPDLAADAHGQVLAQLSPDQRGQLAQQYQNAHNDPNSPFDGYNYSDPNQAADPSSLGRMAQQAEQQDPDLFDKIFGSGSPLGSTAGKVALAGIAAYLASRVLGGQQGNSGGLGGLLGGLSGQPGESHRKS